MNTTIEPQEKHNEKTVTVQNLMLYISKELLHNQVLQLPLLFQDVASNGERLFLVKFRDQAGDGVFGVAVDHHCVVSGEQGVLKA